MGYRVIPHKKIALNFNREVNYWELAQRSCISMIKVAPRPKYISCVTAISAEIKVNLLKITPATQYTQFGYSILHCYTLCGISLKVLQTRSKKSKGSNGISINLSCSRLTNPITLKLRGGEMKASVDFYFWCCLHSC